MSPVMPPLELDELELLVVLELELVVELEVVLELDDDAMPPVPLLELDVPPPVPPVPLLLVVELDDVPPPIPPVPLLLVVELDDVAPPVPLLLVVELDVVELDVVELDEDVPVPPEPPVPLPPPPPQAEASVAAAATRPSRNIKRAMVRCLLKKSVRTLAVARRRFNAHGPSRGQRCAPSRKCHASATSTIFPATPPASSICCARFTSSSGKRSTMRGSIFLSFRSASTLGRSSWNGFGSSR
jgi:hypothetical protein